MSNQMKYKGQNHQGPKHSSPYPVSRLAPAMDLVELAKEVAKTDDLLTLQAAGKLRLLAEQIEALQNKAKDILTETRWNQELHSVQCMVKKRVGEIYHLYRRPDESLMFSIISPGEWGRTLDRSGLKFVGSFRLEHDKTFTHLQKTKEDTR